MPGIEPGTTEQLSQGSVQGMLEDVHCTVVYMGRELESLLVSRWRNTCVKCSEWALKDYFAAVRNDGLDCLHSNIDGS